MVERDVDDDGLMKMRLQMMKVMTMMKIMLLPSVLGQLALLPSPIRFEFGTKLSGA